MKKLVVIMILLSSVIFANEMEDNIQLMITYGDTIRNNESYKDKMEQFKAAVEPLLASKLIEIDYLTESITLSRFMWDNMDVESKKGVCIALYFYVTEKTKRNNLSIYVDYTAVFWVTRGNLYVIKIY